MTTPRHSIVVPVYNEEEGIPSLVARLEKLIKTIQPETTEIIFVNDGSQDKSGEALDLAGAKNSNFKVIHFSRNFGHQLAITAGIELANGETVSVIDADLQDPPELIVEMISKWKEGFDVVYAVRRVRVGETWFKLWTAKMFYRLLHKLTDVNIPLDTGDFRLMDRKVVNAFLKLKERHRFVRGMVAWLGFRQVGIPYDRAERQFSETHYPFKKMLTFAFDGITSFSTVPLRLATYLGLTSASLALFIGSWTLYVKFISGAAIQGWASVMLIVLFLGGIQLVTLGIFGEYLGRIYDEGKARPLYIIASKTGFNSPKQD
jgi:dolichol-phosphate mannosyltransferase